MGNYTSEGTKECCLLLVAELGRPQNKYEKISGIIIMTIFRSGCYSIILTPQLLQSDAATRL